MDGGQLWTAAAQQSFRPAGGYRVIVARLPGAGEAREQASPLLPWLVSFGSREQPRAGLDCVRQLPFKGGKVPGAQQAPGAQGACLFHKNLFFER
jgi:hypothetical protein